MSGRWIAGAAIVFVVLAACSPAPREPAERVAWPSGVKFDYQLGGSYAPPAGTGLVVRDSTATPAAGLYNICYVNGFQTQPADRANWLAERRDLVLSTADGRPLVDPKWPDELILDTSSSANRRRLAGFVGSTIKLCARKGFQAVEIDNLDSFSRSGGALTAADNLAFAGDLARIAHTAGLMIGQKNAAEFGDRGQRAGFDFAVAEECVRYAECDSYAEVYGDRVIDIEYTDNLGRDLTQLCGRPGTPKSIILRDRNLVPAGDPAYLYRRC